MQKSAQTPPARSKDTGHRLDAMPDKGRKYEPFYNTAIGRDRRSVDRELRLDQKR